MTRIKYFSHPSNKTQSFGNPDVKEFVGVSQWTYNQTHPGQTQMEPTPGILPTDPQQSPQTQSGCGPTIIGEKE